MVYFEQNFVHSLIGTLLYPKKDFVFHKLIIDTSKMMCYCTLKHTHTHTHTKREKIMFLKSNGNDLIKLSYTVSKKKM